MRLEFTNAILTLVVLTACSDSNFSSQVKTRSPPSISQEEKANGLPQASGENLPVGCQVSFDYNPQEIKCAIPFSATDTIWQNSGDVWSNRFNSVSDKQAQIISPLESENSPDSGKLQCQLVPGSDVLVYVSHVKISQSGSYTVDSLIDDKGAVRFWRDGDPGREIKVAGNAVGQPITLETGHYAIVVDAQDEGAYTNGMGMSVKNTSTGNVVRRSINVGSDWCIFRTKANGLTRTGDGDLDLGKFVLEAAKCRSCFEGPKT